MSDSINYGALMHDAMRGLIRKVLEKIASDGLPGDHHFFISFDTCVAGVKIADWIKERYPEEMTIVIQNWFDNLEVDEDGFGISLNFGDTPEHLYIPYDAVQTFVDPSVEFGLRFDAPDFEDDDFSDPISETADISEFAPQESSSKEDQSSEEAKVSSENKGQGEVVSLDQFRKQ